MEKVYSYDELASILGCSRTAIAKKVKPDENNPSVERYKNRFEVVINDGKKCILIDDEALEEEKLKSKGFKNVVNNSSNTSEMQSESNKQVKEDESKAEKSLDVTERYMDKFLMMQQHLYNQLHDRDKQILLLSVNEKQKEEAFIRTQAENSELTEKYNVMQKKYNIAKKVIYCFITLALIYGTFVITMKQNYNNVTNDLQNVSGNVNNVQQQVINDKKAAEVQEVVTPQAPQQAKNANVQQKRK